MWLRILSIGLLLAVMGCNSDPRCRRETALLRAEILDLEDKYYLTKAQRDEALGALNAHGKQELAGKIGQRSPSDPRPQSAGVYHGDVIYEGEYYGGEVYFDEGPFIEAEHYRGGSDAFRAYQDQQSLLPHSGSEFFHEGYSLPDPTVVPPEYRPAPSSTSPAQVPNQTSPRTPNPREMVPRESIRNVPDHELPVPNQGQGAGVAPEIEGAARPWTRPGPSTGGARTVAATISATGTITEVVIDKEKTGLVMYDADSMELALLIKLRDGKGNSLLKPGSLTISIIDPFATIPQQRLGLWKFLPEEVELFFTDSPTEPGIILNLPFEDGVPQGKEIAVLVRYQTDDARALETTARIKTKAKSGASTLAGGERVGNDPMLIDDPPTQNSGDAAKAAPAWRPVR